MLFGPAGDRLAVDILNPEPGFVGCFDFIHKMNLTELFAVECSVEMAPEEMEAVWYPTHMTMAYEDERIAFHETKTVIGADLAVSLMEWENRSEERIELGLRCRPEGFEKTDELFCASAESDAGYGLYAESGILRFGIQIGIAAFWNHREPKIVIEPGQKVAVRAAAAVENLAAAAYSQERLKEKICDFFRCFQNSSDDEMLEALLSENHRFYESAPSFVCSDKRMNRCWEYRWYILKNSMCRPGLGRFQETVMYEGRDHRMKKDPLKPSGWEFSKLIPLSTPLHVQDLRWHPDRERTKEIIRSAFAAQNEDGLILSAYVEGEQKSYANYIIWSIWKNYLVDGDRMFLAEMAPAMERYIAGHEKVYGNDRDSLLIERNHNMTGKEYQPGYWYFKGWKEQGSYPANPKDPAFFTPLKRVDRSVYHYQNLQGLANIMKVLSQEKAKRDQIAVKYRLNRPVENETISEDGRSRGDRSISEKSREDRSIRVDRGTGECRSIWETCEEKADFYQKKADQARKDILEKMWDPETGFFYDLHYETDEKAMVRHIVGIDPFWAQITESEHDRGILPLMDPEAFCTGSGFATVSKDCPVFSPSGGWMGNYIKGRDGCVWCGPSWPFTTGIALEALGNESRNHGHAYDAWFDRMLNEYTAQHFRDGDKNRPYLVEHYNAVTGERISDEADYNHSFWLDLIIRFVVGITVEENRIIIDPLKTHLRWWKLDNLMIRGHQLQISMEEKQGSAVDVLSVRMDENEMIFAEVGEPVVLRLEKK